MTARGSDRGGGIRHGAVLLIVSIVAGGLSLHVEVGVLFLEWPPPLVGGGSSAEEGMAQGRRAADVPRVLSCSSSSGGDGARGRPRGRGRRVASPLAAVAEAARSRERARCFASRSARPAPSLGGRLLGAEGSRCPSLPEGIGLACSASHDCAGRRHGGRRRL